MRIGYYKKLKNNIKKHFYDGLKFDSKLELFFYKLLKKNKFKFEFQKPYVLLEGFRYNDKAVRKMTLTVDFYLSDLNILIDTKGFQRNDNKIKWKLLKKKLYDLGEAPLIYMPKTQKQCLELINQLNEK